MNTRNVLIICYNFPPIGGGGVPRPLKMAKYLGEYGWGVHVLTVDPTYHATLDPSLLAQLPSDVAIHRAKELSLFPRGGQAAQPVVATSGDGAAAQRASMKSVLKKQLVQFLKKAKPYLMVPDDQILWMPGAIKLGREIMRREKIDVIFSTSGPVTNHLVARKLASEFSCKWVADFRDPWTQNMHTSGIAWRENWEERMEDQVMAQADAVTTVTATFATNFLKKHKQRIKRMELIYNGFDQADFEGLEPSFEAPNKFHAVYAGILYQKRNPRLLLQAIRELIDAGEVDQKDILLSFAGVFDYPGYSENQDCVEALGLGENVRLLGNLPHKTALGLMKGADALLLIGDVSADAGAYIPGKLYEYMGIGNPILALNKPGEATEIIRNFRLGQVADPEQKDAIKHAYLELYKEWKNQGHTDGEGRGSDFAERVRPYERREQARQLAKLMDELTSQ
ncbi:glycosyl transferase family 1 [Brevibacillus reuszeri]|uniref:Glycosyl transferase family 1 n=1 Tax=Brevibacillus reuszeri TaxID=54915 RepID=A0A0K9YZQ2_9BACL|nr:glycosyltransferase [Brevibacillus reuszeri]KNB73705.1 glycosyl transferase family 1 [Brevibacillus reuszeri]MED1858485.1 glycosyltransferase [Brevibacillus reuszeri]GED69460.1 glycosyl transferase family 1 [Brevibacillus reuszeri]